MILVTGATGTIGAELVRLLSSAGAAARGLSRHPADAPQLDGVEWVWADLADPATLGEPMSGVNQLFLLTGNTDDMVQLQQNAIEVAEREGVRHILKLSALGASARSRAVIALWHHNIESRLRSGTAVATVLRPHHFMHNLLGPDVLDRDAGVVRAQSGDGEIPFIDTRDIAEVARCILMDEHDWGGVHTLTGPAAVSHAAAVATISAMTGRALRFEAESLDEAWSRLRRAGQPPWLVASKLEIARYQRAGGPTARTTDTVQRITGRSPRSLADFATDHREQFLPQS